MSPLQPVFLNLWRSYQVSLLNAEKLWESLYAQHTHKSRYYHDLSHLENLYAQLEPLKPHIEDWEAVLFALFYHDYVYKATKKDNEVKSAELLRGLMESYHLPQALIDKATHIILATQKHEASDLDTCYFLDADLSVLGMDWEIYSNYYQGVRKEYVIYPDIIYKPGRKKVLQYFLNMPTIYKTDCFKGKFETTARVNLQRELGQL